ncbi:hypothetical protein ACUN90_30300 [Escherichia sp. SP-MK2]
MVQEYKMFWRLANKYPEIPFVPTEELDEVWHLHMLYPQNYYPDCKKYFNGLLHHYAGFGKKSKRFESVLSKSAILVLLLKKGV